MNENFRISTESPLKGTTRRREAILDWNGEEPGEESGKADIVAEL